MVTIATPVSATIPPKIIIGVKGVRKNSEAKITDSTGDARLNLELSYARALSVRSYLAGKGVAVARLSAYGFGSSRPLAATAASAGVNRRVEIRKAPE